MLPSPAPPGRLELPDGSGKQGHPVVDLYTEVLQGAMYRIGRLWEENQITVAREHMATAITQFVIAHLYPLIRLAPKPRGRIVLTGAEGEQHQVGANVVADVLEASGWDVRFLGTNTPVSGVLGGDRSSTGRGFWESRRPCFSMCPM